MVDMPETAKARPKIGARTTPGEVRVPFGILIIGNSKSSKWVVVSNPQSPFEQRRGDYARPFPTGYVDASLSR